MRTSGIIKAMSISSQRDMLRLTGARETISDICCRRRKETWLSHDSPRVERLSVEGTKVGVVMKAKPMGVLLVMLVGWMNRHRQDAIVYVKVKTIIGEVLIMKNLPSSNWRWPMDWPRWHTSVPTPQTMESTRTGSASWAFRPAA